MAGAAARPTHFLPPDELEPEEPLCPGYLVAGNMHIGGCQGAAQKAGQAGGGLQHTHLTAGAMTAWILSRSLLGMSRMPA
jgi:hypothetical protein